jgi:sugar lactone lactonase YvrE
MIKKPIHLILFAFFCLIFSCKNDPVAPDPSKPDETTIDKNLLTGWWAPVEKGKAKIYFGADNFFFQDTTVTDAYKTIEPIAGFWRLSGQKIQYSDMQNGAVTTTYNVVTLTAGSLIIKNGATTSAFIKTNRLAISSPAISTIAGNGILTNTGDNGPAVNATVGDLRGIITDKVGNVYFCDAFYNVVRKISAADGKISTIAGTGKHFQNIEDFKPYIDNIPATSADLNTPSGLAFDAAGNLYVSEANFYNGRVDKISTDGKITLVAGSLKLGLQDVGDGGLAVNALLREPVGIAIDASGNIYIADLSNYRIRKVSATDHKITTVAGNGTQSFGSPIENIAATSTEVSPMYLSVDTDNNIYFSDMFSGRIRKVTASTGIISKFAGNQSNGNIDEGPISEASVGGPWGFCMAETGDMYLIGDFMSVRKIDMKTKIISKIAGNGFSGFIGNGPHATAYSLHAAYQVAVDNNGNVYITEPGRIKKVNSK